MQEEQRSRWDQRVALGLQAVLEPSVALVAAFLVILATLVAILPLRFTLEYPLLAAEGFDPQHLTRSAVRDRAEALGMAERTFLELNGGQTRLVLENVDGIRDYLEVRQRVPQMLTDFGFQPSMPRSAMAGPQQLLTQDTSILYKLFAVQSVVLLAIGGLMRRWRVWPEWPRPRSRPLRSVLFGLGGGVVALVLSGAAGWFLEWIGLEVQEQQWLLELFSRPETLLLMVPWIVVVGPIAEEVFFRGYVLRFSSQLIGFPAGLIISSVMFGLVHFNPVGLPIYTIVGAVMAYVYKRTGSMAAPIVGHVAYNSLVLIISNLAVGAERAAG